MTLASFRLFDFIHLRYADIITDNVESIFAHKETEWTIRIEEVQRSGSEEWHKRITNCCILNQMP